MNEYCLFDPIMVTAAFIARSYFQCYCLISGARTIIFISRDNELTKACLRNSSLSTGVLRWCMSCRVMNAIGYWSRDQHIINVTFFGKRNIKLWLRNLPHTYSIRFTRKKRSRSLYTCQYFPGEMCGNLEN